MMIQLDWDKIEEGLDVIEGIIGPGFKETQEAIYRGQPIIFSNNEGEIIISVNYHHPQTCFKPYGIEMRGKISLKGEIYQKEIRVITYQPYLKRIIIKPA